MNLYDTKDNTINRRKKIANANKSKSFYPSLAICLPMNTHVENRIC